MSGGSEFFSVGHHFLPKLLYFAEAKIGGRSSS